MKFSVHVVVFSNSRDVNLFHFSLIYKKKIDGLIKYSNMCAGRK